MSELAALSLGEDATPAGAGKFYEVVDGQVVEPPEMGAFETRIASILFYFLWAHVVQRRSGRVDAEMLYLIDPAGNLQRRPDLAFVSYARWPEDTPVPRTAAWNVVPDLAVEVVSPSNTYAEVIEKLDEYFRAGVRSVWIVYPPGRRVSVYQHPKSVTLLDASDELDGGEVLPGFRLRLSDLFTDAT